VRSAGNCCQEEESKEELNEEPNCMLRLRGLRLAVAQVVWQQELCPIESIRALCSHSQ